ncbi:thioredoxin family protein [Gracilimonas mengyeensis]|nr:thioredoxin fold domain-containing protein [Gracilimonas mengyeensis]
MYTYLSSATKRIAHILFLLLFATSVSCAQQSEESSETQANEESESQAGQSNIPFDWYSLEEAQRLAAENDKKVLVYAEAVWCTYCQRVRKEVFPQQEVEEVTEQYFYPVLVDIESQDTLTFRGEEMTQAEFSRAMRVTGTPTFIFIDSEGEIIAGQPGFIPTDIYVQMLTYVGTDAYQDQSFDEFAEN